MKSLYQFKISISGCNYELWLNDIRIDIQMSDRSLSYDLSVNQWLRAKRNDVKVVLFPITGKAELSPGSYFKLSIVESANAANNTLKKNEIINISSPNFQEIKDKNPKAQLPKFEFGDQFIINSVFPNRIFTDLITLNTNTEEVFGIYKNIHALIIKKDKQALLKLMDFKMSQFAAAYDESLSGEIARQSGFWDMLFEEKIEPLNFDNYKLKYFLGKKLICLEDRIGDQPIFFTGEPGSGTTFYPFYFGKTNENDRWIIAL